MSRALARPRLTARGVVPFVVAGALALLQAGCFVDGVAGPGLAVIGSHVTYSMRYVAGTGSNGTSHPVVIADVPLGWTVVSSTYSGVTNGTPVSGLGTVSATDPASTSAGLPALAAGYQRLYFMTGPFTPFTMTDAGTVKLTFVVGGATGPFTLKFWGSAKEEGSGPGKQTVPATAAVSVQSAVTFGCVADAATLCIDDLPGDARYRLQTSWATAQGGLFQGTGHPLSMLPMGVAHGGVFWFFGADNPEMMVKVINGCGVNGRHWFFASAGTNVGFTVSVTDTFTGGVKSYVNPDVTAAMPVQDVNAFGCP